MLATVAESVMEVMTLSEFAIVEARSHRYARHAYSGLAGAGRGQG